MTMQEIIQEIATLTTDERKELIYILVESLTTPSDSQPNVHRGCIKVQRGLVTILMNY
jgi:hypothetical protein